MQFKIVEDIGSKAKQIEKTAGKWGLRLIYAGVLWSAISAWCMGTRGPPKLKTQLPEYRQRMKGLSENPNSARFEDSPEYQVAQQLWESRQHPSIFQ